MASIIEGYNYDIFISYRQKDNKHDGWVTEFVDNLKGELESTFKEEISVYFDINPHDGLLETHDVDESLKEKLKCLVFIPIISRTYCDPKSFAWEHEFKTFVEQASNDEFGLKIKLSNGNVASRVLPIVIYDLDKQDIKLFESVHRGVLRGVEFIYKSAGVNRPLRSKEEKPQENLNNTLYRDQVNKVANSIKDVLNSLNAREQSVDETITEPKIAGEKISAKKAIKKKPREIPSVSIFERLPTLTSLNRNTWRKVALIILFLLVSIGAYWVGRKASPLPSSRLMLRYDIPLMQSLTRTGRKALAISKDGKYLVSVMTNLQLNLKSLDNDEPAIPISGTTNSRYPFFSPDGKWIGYEDHVEQKIMKIQVQGGNPIAICDMKGGGNGSSWAGKYIIFAVRNEIYRVPDSGGLPELIYPLNKSENEPMIWNPQLLPDNKTLLFSQATDDGYWCIKTWCVDSEKKPVVLVDRGRDGRYLNSGHIAYSLDNSIYVCKFDPRTNRIVSEPQTIKTKTIYEAPSLVYGASQFDFSDNGILVYYEKLPVQVFKNQLVWIEPSGEIKPITKIAKQYSNPRISNDAQNIAVDVINEKGSGIEIINTRLGTSTLFVENAQNAIWV